MEALYLACGAGEPQLKRDPLGGCTIMPRRTLQLTVLVQALATSACLSPPTPLPAQAVQQLRPSDFLVAGLPDQADSATVRHLLGAPDSITTGDDPSQASGDLLAWWYGDLQVIFVDRVRVLGEWLNGPSRHTSRGLHVGAPTADIKRLYGPSMPTPGDSTFMYREPGDEPTPRYLFVSATDGRVTAIYIGRLID
jgi:hypothetical protein